MFVWPRLVSLCTEPALLSRVHDTEACQEMGRQADGENDAETESGSVVHLYSPASDKLIQQECFAKDGR